MSTISDENTTRFSFRTGVHTYRDGECWAEYDGPSRAGFFRAINGSAVEITAEEYGEWRLTRQPHLRDAGWTARQLGYR